MTEREERKEERKGNEMRVPKEGMKREEED